MRLLLLLLLLLLGGCCGVLLAEQPAEQPPYSFWWAVGSPGLAFDPRNASAIGPRVATVTSQFTLSWPAIAKSAAGQPVTRNGGVPQAGNLTLHLQAFADAVNNAQHGGPASCTNLPNGRWDCVPEDFDGHCVIDFEEWNGVWEEAYPRYRNASLALVRDAHPAWAAAEVEGEAKRQFEAAAVEFLAATVRRGRALRPRCRWGYYGVPCAPAACLGAVRCTNTSAGPLCGFDDPVQGALFRNLSQVVQPVLDASDAVYPLGNPPPPPVLFLLPPPPPTTRQCRLTALCSRSAERR